MRVTKPGTTLLERRSPLWLCFGLSALLSGCVSKNAGYDTFQRTAEERGLLAPAREEKDVSQETARLLRGGVTSETVQKSRS